MKNTLSIITFLIYIGFAEGYESGMDVRKFHLMYPGITGFIIADTLITHQHNHTMNEQYELLLQAAPEEIVARKKTKLLFKSVKNKTNNVLLETNHEKKIHLIIVSNDLSYFEHLHPQTDGSLYSVETIFPSGGTYLLFADYTPAGGEQQHKKFRIVVKGIVRDTISYRTEKNISVAGGYKVMLSLPSEKIIAGAATQIPVTVSKDDIELPATRLDDYIGSKAHVILIGLADKTFLHAHPQVVNNRLSIRVEFNESGYYRVWLQFKLNGRLNTADFVIRVEEKTQHINHQIIHHH